MRSTTIGLVAALCAVGLPAQAQEGRYRLERTDGGLVRMDTHTGRIELCTQKADGLQCRMAEGAQSSTDAQAVGALQARVDYLEKRIAALEAGGADTKSSLPSDEDFERSLGFMEKFMRRFMGIARDIEQQKPETPAPNRT